MADPGRKLKKILFICGITGAVYFGFRYLLPLVVPFLLAYGTAVCLWPSVRYAKRRFRWTFRGKERHLPVSLVGTVELLFLLGILMTSIYLVVRRLFEQMNRFLTLLPEWILGADEILTGLCQKIEQVFGLKTNSFVALAANMVEELGDMIRNSTMPAIMNNSVAIVKILAGMLLFLILFLISTVMFLQEMETIRERKSNSIFHKEFAMIGRRLTLVGNVWLKTQILILAVTSGLCVIGMFLIRNPYSLLLGIGIGLMDAFPFLGAGVVLIPWAVICFIKGSWAHGMILVGLYLTCYVVRQFMETKIMGNKMGLSALETLISMYVGLLLFGFSGVLLGPVGLLVIEDLLELYGDERR